MGLMNFTDFAEQLFSGVFEYLGHCRARVGSFSESLSLALCLSLRGPADVDRGELAIIGEWVAVGDNCWLMQ